MCGEDSDSQCQGVNERVWEEFIGVLYPQTIHPRCCVCCSYVDHDLALVTLETFSPHPSRLRLKGRAKAFLGPDCWFICDEAPTWLDNWLPTTVDRVSLGKRLGRGAPGRSVGDDQD